MSQKRARSRRAARRSADFGLGPQWIAPKETAIGIGDGFRAGSRETHAIVWFVEKHALNADGFCSLNCQAQFDFIRHVKHDKVTAVLWLKVAPCLKTGMADLHNLIGQGQIGANQGVGMRGRTLLMGHE